jgi:hypothetical protein
MAGALTVPGRPQWHHVAGYVRHRGIARPPIRGMLLWRRSGFFVRGARPAQAELPTSAGQQTAGMSVLESKVFLLGVQERAEDGEVVHT